MSLKIKALVVLLCLCSNIFASQEMQLGRQLKSLNNHPIKTIKSKQGDIIDCVDINTQPALHHPLLQNHIVQTRPQSFPTGITKSSSRGTTLELKSEREACPDGTVPIHRIRKEDIVKANGVAMNGSSGKHAALMFMKISERPRYHGAVGRLSVYNLTIPGDQTSAATVWAQNGPPHQLDRNLISAGWMVSPQINGDVHTRLYVYWTVDGGHMTGCYDMLCQGFVQVDRVIAPKYEFSPVSSYGGDQYDFGIFVFKDRPTGNWWLAVTGKDEGVVKVGYWPREILTDLNYGANSVGWGGYVIGGDDGISPPMGNGHMADGDYSHACYFTQIMYVDESSRAHGPWVGGSCKNVDKPGCYGLEKGPEFWKGKSQGYGFTFGGPGGPCD